MQILDALPMVWKNSLLSCGPNSGKAFVLSNHIQLRLKNMCVGIDQAVSKNLYKGIRAKYESMHSNCAKEIYGSVLRYMFRLAQNKQIVI